MLQEKDSEALMGIRLIPKSLLAQWVKEGKDMDVGFYNFYAE